MQRGRTQLLRRSWRQLGQHGERGHHAQVAQDDPLAQQRGRVGGLDHERAVAELRLDHLLRLRLLTLHLHTHHTTVKT